MKIWFASGNLHKRKELTEILKTNLKNPNDLEILSPKDFGLEFNPEEKGSSFLENALIKARELSRLLEEKRPAPFSPGDPIIADDSGICVDALDESPGIYSARYGGDGLSDADRNSLLLSDLGDTANRKARFVCAMVLYYSPERFFIAEESMEGEIVKNIDAARGMGGFGYDPILYIKEAALTVAELSSEEKNTTSHRAKAAKAIAKIFSGGL